MVVDSRLLLHQTSQVLDVGLQQNLRKTSPNHQDFGVETSAKGIVRLNRSQISIILTYDVLGNELDTLMNLKDIFQKSIWNLLNLHSSQHQHYRQVDCDDCLKEEWFEVVGSMPY